MSIHKIHNIHSYKKAKHVVKDLESMLKVVNISILGLSSHVKYQVGARLMRVLLENRKELEKHIATCNKIISSKGCMDEV